MQKIFICLILFLASFEVSYAQDNSVQENISQPNSLQEIVEEPSDVSSTSTSPIFDDKLLLNGYSEKYRAHSKEILIEMIKDETLTSYKVAAAIRVFREKYADEIFLAEKGGVEKILLRRLHRDDSPFVQVEIMETLCRLDRYRYFRSMIPGLIQKLDHYNSTVNEIAFAGLEQLLSGSNSHNSREARIVFNTLRQVLFLMRKRLAGVKEPNLLLKQKLQLLRWSLKILGTQEIQRLPKEVINLL